MHNTMTVQDFFRRFPTDDACLAHLMRFRYGESLECPRCKQAGKFHRIKKIPAYECQWCGYHIHPMVGTPFEDSHTALQKWFYAMYLFTTSRHGVPAKELQRQLGVTYKTAWRIGHEIRKYMAEIDGDDRLSGHVEADETMIGGRRSGKRGRGAAGKTIVFGMLQRKGDIMTRVVPDATRNTLHGIIEQHVAKQSTISTDELTSYKTLDAKGYAHGTVEHGTKEYVRGIHHVNSVEGFWSQIKRSIKGTHIHVSKQHLAKYLGEFEFRYNLRATPSLMFDRLVMGF
ncbi:MAG: IS1595 family transposase [Candidatus Omnitrophota bacterium]|nr:IS1595 family transposase [Candidatus Omnitrophota bacterium]